MKCIELDLADFLLARENRQRRRTGESASLVLFPLQRLPLALLAFCHLILKTAGMSSIFNIHLNRSFSICSYSKKYEPRTSETFLSPSLRFLQTQFCPQRALYFPNISGTCLLDRKTKHTADMLLGKVSIVSLLSSKISEEHTKSFYEPTLEAFSGNKDFQLIQVGIEATETNA